MDTTDYVTAIIFSLILFSGWPSTGFSSESFSGDEFGCIKYSTRSLDTCAEEGVTRKILVKANPLTGGCAIFNEDRGQVENHSLGSLIFVDKDNWKCSLPKSMLDLQSGVGMDNGAISYTVIDSHGLIPNTYSPLMRTDTIIGKIKHYWYAAALWQ
ncbi:hypothetical protein ACXX82_17425 [Glaciimonas sp. GNP009]